MNDERDDRSGGRHSRQQPQGGPEYGRPGEGPVSPNSRQPAPGGQGWPQNSPQQPPQRPAPPPSPGGGGGPAWPEDDARGAPQGRHGADQRGWPGSDQPSPQWPGDSRTPGRNQPPQSGPAPGGASRQAQESAQEQTGAWSPSFDDDDDSPLSERLSGRSAGGAASGNQAAGGQPGDGQSGRSLDLPTSYTKQPPPPPPPNQAPTRQSPMPPSHSQDDAPTRNIPAASESPGGSASSSAQHGQRGAGAAGAAAAGAAAAAAGAAAAGGSLAGAGVSGTAAGSAGNPEQREPQLITHKSSHGGYNYYGDDDSDDSYSSYGSDDDYDDYDDYDKDGGHLDDPDDLDDEMSAARRKRRTWRIARRACYVAAALMIIIPAAAFAVCYQLWSVDSPEDVASRTSQTVTVTYADNSELTRIIPNGENRTMIRDLDQEVSKDMQNATLAAEDASFYRNQGFDAMGILYAVFKQATGRAGGGSTLTQQYIKLTTKADEATITRKWKEIVLAVKMTNQYEKPDILKAYLNTAYYGRGAYGIHAAADAYFGKKPTELTAEESCILAGMVQRPTQNDPKVDPRNAERRWNYVMDQMAKNGWITQDRRSSAQMPVTLDRFAWRGPQMTGSQAHIKQQVLAELNEAGYNDATLARQGYKIHTTIDRKAQDAAEDAVNRVTGNQPENLKTSLVAIDPKTGEVRAYYGGGTKVGGFDWANSPQEPGSSFKPFVALAALKTGSGIGETYDGSSPQEIAGSTFNNSEGVSCDSPQYCSVREAMTKSVNTVFVNMAVKFGTPNVAEAAYSAGIPKQINNKQTLHNADGRVDAGIALGQYPVRTIDMASAYSTFANNGMRAKPHFVVSLEHNGEIERPFDAQAKPALDPSPKEAAKLAGNVTASMMDVVKNPKKPLNLFDNRPVAAKTGTHQYLDTKQNAKAWMVGFTPQIATAVSIGADNNGKPAPVVDNKGAAIYGSGLPGSVWQMFMNSYLKGKPIEQFPPFEKIGQFENKLPPPPPPTEKPEPSTPWTIPTEQPTRTTETSEKPTTSTSKDPVDNCGGLFPPPSCRNKPGNEW